MFDFSRLPIGKWAEIVWSPGSVVRHLAVAFDEALRRYRGNPCCIMHGRGPACCVVLALHRIGWSATSYRHWITNRGVAIDLAPECPRTVLRLIDASVARWQWRQVADNSSLDLALLREGACIKPMKQLLHSKAGPLSGEQRAVLHNAATGILWPTSRRAEAGYVDSPICDTVILPGCFLILDCCTIITS